MTIDFKDIEVKEYKSKNEAFEKLCNYIFRLYGEKNEYHAKFISNNGSGGDGGVEAYWQFDNDDEYAIQSKYFIDGFGNAQVNQIKDSIDTALKYHPNIKKYYICIPIELTNKRNGKGLSQREKFENIKQKYNIEIILWDASELKNFLLIKSPEKSQGLIKYFFNKEIFTKTWFKDHFRNIQLQAGPRYSSENNIKQDIFYSLITSSITHNDVLKLRNLYKETKTYFHNLLLGKLKDKTKIEEICKDFRILSEDILYKETVEINSYNEFAKKYKEFSDLLYNIEIIGDDSYYKRKIMSSLNKIANILELFSHKNILVRGLAGTGKTHLVCDLVREAVETNQFISVLFFGNRFYEHSLEKAILSQVPEFDSLDIFLSTLNSYARIKNQIAYLIIDTINEWDTLKNSDKFCEVNLIINKIKSYSNIKFIITCREEYIDDIFKKTDNIDEIKRINGFCNNIMEAFYSFCKYYNIKYPTKLCLFPEISNPLILKTICETFKNRDFPDNYLSMSDVIQTYLETINVSISEKLNIDSKDNLVIKEIKKIVEILYRNKSSFISRDKIKSKVQRFEQFKDWKKQILYWLEKNSFLYLSENYCDISYQRYKDYSFAKLFLDKIKKYKYFNWFLKCKIYRKCKKLFNLNLIFEEGLIDMLSILVPENLNIEFIEIYKGRKISLYNLKMLISAFYNSIYYRKPDKISNKTLRLFEAHKNVKFGTENHNFSDYYWETLIKTAYIENHPLNAEYLHKILYPLSIADIDADWTQYISGYNSESRENFDLKHIVDMFLKIDNKKLSDKSILLGATLLLWFTASTDKYLREYSVKSCVNILKNKEELLIKIFDKFKDVNDLFVRESLYLVVYGCILYANKNDNLKILSDLLYENVFEITPVFPNITIRESAYNSIKEIYKKIGESCKYERLEPPYDYKIDIYPDKKDLEVFCDKKIKNIHYFYPHAPADINSNEIFYSSTTLDFFCYILNDVNKFLGADKIKASYWICKKSYDYGWNIEKHGQFDTDIMSDYGDRSPRKIERIGKKYQWLAFREYLCNLVDNYKYEDNSISYYDVLKEYRIIDPTYFSVKDVEYFYYNTRKGIFNPFDKNYFKNENFEDQKKWLDETQGDICKGNNLIEYDLDGKDFFIFDNTINIYEDKENSINSEYYRDFGIKINSIIYNKVDKDKILSVLGNRSNETNGFQLIYENEISKCYFKEYNQNMNEKGNNILFTEDTLKNIEYCRSTNLLSILSFSGEDYIHERVPSVKLIKSLNLQLLNNGTWITKDNKQIIFTKDGRLVVNKYDFIKLLWKNDLDIMFLVSSEKRLINKNDHRSLPWNWYFTIYSYDDYIILKELYHKLLTN